jgi:hypothetical protein
VIGLVKYNCPYYVCIYAVICEICLTFSFTLYMKTYCLQGHNAA